MVATAIFDFQICDILLADSVWSAQTLNCPNFVKIGRSIAEILQFFLEFSRWPPLPSWIFEIAKFYWLLGSTGSIRMYMPNFVKNGQSVANFLIFQDGGRPPSWICLGHIWTTDSEYLGVSITLQNLVMIDTVVFIISTFKYLTRLAGKCLFTPQNWGFRAI